MIFPSAELQGLTALVLGDVMLDRYLEGRVARISPEAPVPVVTLRKSWERPGGAGNVAASLAALRCRVTVGGIVGRDVEGRLLRDRLIDAGVSRTQLVECETVQTVCKTRVMASSHQQMLRLDQDGSRAGYEAAAAQLERLVLPFIGEHQVVVLADYEKGVLTPRLLARVIAECRRLGIPCLVDPKKPTFEAYAGATLLTPNLLEAERAAGGPLASDDAIANAAERMRLQYKLDYMLVTRGPDGMTLAKAGGVTHLRSVVREVADVTGAGDTVVSVLAASLALGLPAEEACRFASVAAGIAVSKPGVYAVRAAELELALGGHSLKAANGATARARVEEARRDGRRVVFTNGCFDILHAGHLSCLERARRWATSSSSG